MTRLTPSERTLVAVQGLFMLATAIAGIFLNLFIFDRGGFSAVTTYNLMMLAALYSLYMASGYLLRRYSSRDLIQAGLLCLGLLYLAVFVAGTHAVQWLAPLSLLNGVGAGLYWSGINVNSYVDTHMATRTRYFARLRPIMNSASAFGPIAGGAVIAIARGAGHADAGYGIVFAALSCALFAAAFVCRSLRSYSKVQFSISDVVRHRRTVAWRVVTAQQALAGAWDISFLTVSVLVIFVAVHHEIAVSAVSAAAAALYAATILIAARALTRATWFSAVGMVLIPLGVLGLGLEPNWLGIAAYVLLVRGAAPFLDIPISRVIFDTMDDLPGTWQRKYHLLIEREIALGAGRVTSFIVMAIVFAHGNDLSSARAILVGLAICPLLVGMMQLYLDHNRRTPLAIINPVGA